MLPHGNQPSSPPPDAQPVAGLVRTTHWVLSVCVVCGQGRPDGERHARVARRAARNCTASRCTATCSPGDERDRGADRQATGAGRLAKRERGGRGGREGASADAPLWNRDGEDRRAAMREARRTRLELLDRVVELHPAQACRRRSIGSSRSRRATGRFDHDLELPSCTSQSPPSTPQPVREAGGTPVTVTGAGFNAAGVTAVGFGQSPAAGCQLSATSCSQLSAWTSLPRRHRRPRGVGGRVSVSSSPKSGRPLRRRRWTASSKGGE